MLGHGNVFITEFILMIHKSQEFSALIPRTKLITYTFVKMSLDAFPGLSPYSLLSRLFESLNTLAYIPVCIYLS